MQKKISLLSNPQSLVGELFPHWEDTSALIMAASGGDVAVSGDGRSCRRSCLVVVASLVAKAPNLGGNYQCNIICTHAGKICNTSISTSMQCMQQFDWSECMQQS